MPLYLDGFLIPLASFLAFAYVADVQHSVLLRLLQAMAQVEAHQVRLSQLEQLRTEEALQERVRELERSVQAAQARQEEERAAAEAHVSEGGAVFGVGAWELERSVLAAQARREEERAAAEAHVS